MVTVAFAQGRKGNIEKKDRTPEERATAQTNRLEKQLGLSADQKKQIYSINLDAIKKNEELHAKAKTAGSDKKAIHAERKANNTARVSKIESTLTAEQKTKWETIKAEQKKRAEERRAANGKGKGKEKGKPANDSDDDDDND
jgi:hypothetical protein